MKDFSNILSNVESLSKERQDTLIGICCGENVKLDSETAYVLESLGLIEYRLIDESWRVGPASAQVQMACFRLQETYQK